MSAPGILATARGGLSWALRIGCTVHVIHSFFYEISETQGESMLPTLNYSGDYVHTNKLCQRGKNCQVGDMIVALKPTDPSQRVCKRITGMPGDIIQIDPSTTYSGGGGVISSLSDNIKSSGSNGKSHDVEIDSDMDLNMRLRKSESSSNKRSKGVNPLTSAKENLDEKPMYIKVPEGHCWVTGDNLSRSLDSRSYGVLPLGLIKGKIMAVNTREGDFHRLENNLVKEAK